MRPARFAASCSGPPLSYAGGGDQSHKTTRETPPRYLDGIAITEIIPQTIQDTVNVCQRLRTLYLWVLDSLCIIRSYMISSANCLRCRA